MRVIEPIHYNNCPVCGSERIGYCLTAKDHTVSLQDFEIWHCEACSFRFTQNIPAPAEIGAYYRSENYISHSNTQIGLVNRLYHFARKFTLYQKKQLLQNAVHLQSGKLLDIGAGTGAFCNYMKQAGWNVTGLEPDTVARRVAKEIHQVNLLEIEALFELPAASFDAITLWHVLEHVHELDAYMQQIRKILKPNGRIFIAVPNYTSLDALQYQENWAAYDVPRHLYHFSPHSMQVLLEKHQLHLTKMHPMWFDSLYVSLLSEKIKKGSIPFFSGIWAGLRSNFVTWKDKKRCSSIIYEICNGS